MKFVKKNAFWIILALVIIGVAAWYYLKKKKKGSKEEEKTPDSSPSNPSNPSAGTAGIWDCGSQKKAYELFWQWDKTDGIFFRNQTLTKGTKNKCQTAILQSVLNRFEKANLEEDGQFGPNTETAVFKAFGKKSLNLNDVDAKYKITPQFNTGKSIFDFYKNLTGN